MYKTEANVKITSAYTDVPLVDGDMVTGTGGTATRITIADGATVTLCNLTNTSINNAPGTAYAGIECLGDAHIILLGSNSVKGVWCHAGISVPSGKTLTISGAGSLTATGDGGGAGIGNNNNASCGNITISNGAVTAIGSNLAAGIGGGNSGTCGAITIDGSANVTATGGVYAAGIGSGRNGTCGNITISGGTVTATGGGYAAGIGSGVAYNASITCGDITISGGTVTATGGVYAAGIGSGYGGEDEYDNPYVSSCGDITISGGTVTATGGGNAAGIGSGSRGKFESINITSGITSVIAKRVNVSDNAPVGKGDPDQGSGTVTISDQTLTDRQQIGLDEMPASFAGVTVVKSDYVSSDPWTFKTLTITKNP